MSVEMRLKQLAQLHGWMFIPPMRDSHGGLRDAWLANPSTRKVVTFHWGIPGWVGWSILGEPKVIQEEELERFLSRKE